MACGYELTNIRGQRNATIKDYYINPLNCRTKDFNVLLFHLFKTTLNVNISLQKRTHLEQCCNSYTFKRQTISFKKLIAAWMSNGK